MYACNAVKQHCCLIVIFCACMAGNAPVYLYVIDEGRCGDPFLRAMFSLIVFWDDLFCHPSCMHMCL